MSYKDFDVKKVIKSLGIRVREAAFIAKVVPQSPSPDLLGALRLLRGALVLTSEKARSEILIAPILGEAALKSGTHIFSGENFDVDPANGLTGFVDFLFTREAPGKSIVDPVLCIVEAKRSEIDAQALGQCMATMVAAQRFNQSDQVVFGCVTTGTDWQFLRLTSAVVEIDPTLFYEAQLPVLLGILVSFLNGRMERMAGAETS